MSAPACAARPPDRLDRGHAGQPVLLRARDDPDGRARRANSTAMALPEAGAAPGDDGGRAGEGVGGEQG